MTLTCQIIPRPRSLRMRALLLILAGCIAFSAKKCGEGARSRLDPVVAFRGAHL